MTGGVVEGVGGLNVIRSSEAGKCRHSLIIDYKEKNMFF